MTSLLLTAYFGVALLAALNCMGRMAAGGSGVSPHADPLNTLILFLTGILASALWAPLLVIHLTGWLRSAAGRRSLERLAARARRGQVALPGDRSYRFPS